MPEPAKNGCAVHFSAELAGHAADDAGLGTSDARRLQGGHDGAYGSASAWRERAPARLIFAGFVSGPELAILQSEVKHVANRMTQSALLVAGGAAAAAAVTLFELRRLTGGTRGERRRSQYVEPGHLEPEHVEPESAELPVGRSADPEIDGALSRQQLPQDDTSGGMLLGASEPSLPSDTDLDKIWQSAPNIAEDSQSEGYDAVTPEDLGAVWLERATQTTHDSHERRDEVPDLVALDTAGLSESTLASSHLRDYEDEINDEGEQEIAEDELDEK